MSNRRPWFLWLLLGGWVACVAVAPAAAQQLQPSSPVVAREAEKLAFLLPEVVERLIQGVDPAFRPVVERGLSPAVNPLFASLNAAIVTQLSNLPVASPASATRYEFDRRLGVYVPFAQSLGPILSERAETIGKDKFFFALMHQQFDFDRADDVELRSIVTSLPFPVSGVPGVPDGISGIASSRTYVGLHISQTTGYFTYGLTHAVDVSLATPFISSSMTVRGQGALNVPLLGIATTVAPQSAHASATGLGDQLVRVKARVASGTIRMAIGGDVRLPTGDEFNFHGAGAYGVRAFGIASSSVGAASPHVNVGYEWNGSALLADPAGLTPRQLPDRFSYVLGLDAAVSPRFTVAVDFSDQIALNRTRAVLPVLTPEGTPQSPLGSETVSLHETGLAGGFKARLRGALVMTGNVLVRLNDAGLRARVVPTLGLSYLF
jgi:hypothetical protein